MNKKIIVLGHENPDVDSIVSGYLLEKILNKYGYNADFIIPDSKIEEETINICKNNGLDSSKFMKKIEEKNALYVLVDHHERDINGEIICIVDHHPTTKYIKLDSYYNKKISSTACYICQNNEHLLNEYDLRLAVLATMVDTASFHSNKGTNEDKKWVMDICQKYNFDFNELHKQGLCLTNIYNLKKASLNGLKKYNYYKKKIESSYIQIEDILSNGENINKILDYLKLYIKDNNVDVFVFIVHDMNCFKTKCYLITQNKIEIKEYDEYTSRGSTIMPEIEKKLIKKEF